MPRNLLLLLALPSAQAGWFGKNERVAKWIDHYVQPRGLRTGDKETARRQAMNDKKHGRTRSLSELKRSAAESTEEFRKLMEVEILSYGMYDVNGKIMDYSFMNCPEDWQAKLIEGNCLPYSGYVPGSYDGTNPGGVGTDLGNPPVIPGGTLSAAFGGGTYPAVPLVDTRNTTLSSFATNPCAGKPDLFGEVTDAAVPRWIAADPSSRPRWDSRPSAPPSRSRR